MTKEFSIRRSWLSRKGNSELDVTLCQLQITVGERVVTEYSGEFDHGGDHLEIPAYYLAEWIAENWWPLLWEPRKSEDAGDDADFLARHSILTAQHGFALPKILFVPIGRNIQISASPRDVQFADIRFRKGGLAWPSRKDVESELRQFVISVVRRLTESSISGTSLHEAWNLVEGTAEDEIEFCQYVGALGLSPYSANEAVENTLDRVSPILGRRLAMDLCLASTPENFQAAARTAEIAHGAMALAPLSTLEPLATIPIPADNPMLPAWRRGVQAAQRVRTKLGIKEIDPYGSNLLFEKLKIDPSRRIQHADNNIEGAPVVGAVARKDQIARVALLQHKEVQRRFAAARAAYAAWASENQEESRLLTLAVTRDQQASRAFAAEMTAPFAYIRSQAKGSKLPQHRVFELASNLNVGADVVQKQALNNGLQITPL